MSRESVRLDTVRLGMVGLGGWGKSVVRNFNQTDGCELCTICDSSLQTLDRQRRDYPDAIATGRYQDLLEDVSIGAIALATPAPAHFSMARAALEAGKHVYVEKPMTMNSADAEELVHLADERGLKLMVGHLLEYHPAVQLMKEQVDADALGQIYYIYSQRVNLGVVRQHENAFWSLAPHDISVILYLFGAEPDRILANGQSFLQNGIEDVVFVTLHFPDGRIANIHVSLLDPHKERKMVLVGSEKMLVFDDMAAGEKIRIFDKGASCDSDADGDSGGEMQAISVRHGDIRIPHISTREPLAIETQHFIDCIRNDATPRSDGRDGLRVVRILEEVDRQLHGAIPATFRRAA